MLFYCVVGVGRIVQDDQRSREKEVKVGGVGDV